MLEVFLSYISFLYPGGQRSLSLTYSHSTPLQLNELLLLTTIKLVGVSPSIGVLCYFVRAPISGGGDQIAPSWILYFDYEDNEI